MKKSADIKIFTKKQKSRRKFHSQRSRILTTNTITSGQETVN